MSTGYSTPKLDVPKGYCVAYHKHNDCADQCKSKFSQPFKCSDEHEPGPAMVGKVILEGEEMNLTHFMKGMLPAVPFAAGVAMGQNDRAIITPINVDR